MSFKIPGTPSSRAYTEELADFWEIMVLKNPDFPISAMYIQQELSIELDEINHDGIESEDDIVGTRMQDVMHEIIFRKSAAYQKYPFYFVGSRLYFNTQVSNQIKNTYLFCLLATRLNMKDHKIQNNFDGTKLFEKLAEIIGKNFWGENSQTMIFGTAVNSSFEFKVNKTIGLIGEGHSFLNRNSSFVTKNDDGIDIVLVKEFADTRRSKLVGLGQCKTGTDWQNTVKGEKIRNFCSNWFRDSPVLEPIPIAFITDTLYRESNDYTNLKGLLVLNRFRLMEYLPDVIHDELYGQIQSWVDGALAFLRS
ncbi:MAG: hypothetical protein WBO36_15125 [Saprospiraceae bacterium]